MKWLNRPAETAGLPPDALLKRLVADVTEATGCPPSLKDVELDAVGESLRRVLAARGETTADAIRVIELSARTLGDLGAGDMARRLLVFGSGLVTPAVWEISGGDRIWVLDLRRLVLNAEAQIELTVFRSLDAAIGAMADAWNASSGQGRLGLRHVYGTVARLLGGPDPRGRRSQPLVREIIERSRARLQKLATSRRWQHVPEVLNLD